MGIVYKLKPELKDAIIEEKRNNPQLSCRKLIKLIEEKYQVKVSKSSVNSLIKGAGLSLPLGRRAEAEKTILLEPPPAVVIAAPIISVEPINPPPVAIIPETMAIETVIAKNPDKVVGMGAVFLKAADSLLGGSLLLAESISKRLSQADEKVSLKTEMLIYKLLASNSWLETISKQSIPETEIMSYVAELQRFTEVNQDLLRVINSVIRPVRGFKFILSDKSEFYLDAQCHTIWSSPNTPLDFSVTYWGAISYIKRTLQNDQICTILMPPIDTYPPVELFNSILGLTNYGSKQYSVGLFGDKLETLGTVNVGPVKEWRFIFGLWPSQYSQSRIIKNIGEFTSFHIESLGMAVYLAPAEIVLTQPVVNKSVTLKGIALKTNLNEKIRLVILTNFDDSGYDLERIAKIYLNNWPNLEDGLEDFKRKLEYQAYATDVNSFPVDKLQLRGDTFSDLQNIFDDYLKVLDLYVRRFFFPVAYQKDDLSSMISLLYSLPGRVEWKDNIMFVHLILPPGFEHTKDLEYACRRINERQLVLVNKQRVWLSCA